MQTAKLFVVIPTFNRKQLTVDCIERLIAGTYKEFQIIVCDSGSTDGTSLALASYPSVSVLDVGSEKWWTGAVNEGVNFAISAGAEKVVVMNDDIFFSETLLADLLQKGLQFPNTIISPLQISNTGAFVGFRFSGILKKSEIIYKNPNTPVDNYVDISNGCCLLIPVVAFKIVGIFNNQMCPHYAGDTEFQLRANNNGFKTLATTDIIIEQGKATNTFPKLQLTNIFSSYISPVHINSYLAFGNSLFMGKWKFLFFGFLHHYIFLKTSILTIIKIFKARN